MEAGKEEERCPFFLFYFICVFSLFLGVVGVLIDGDGDE